LYDKPRGLGHRGVYEHTSVCAEDQEGSGKGKSRRDVYVAIDHPLQLNATKKEIVDTEALIERYRNEIEDLKRRLEEKEKGAPALSRRLSAREVSRLRFYNFPRKISVLTPLW